MNARRRKKALQKYANSRLLSWRERLVVTREISGGFTRLIHLITLTVRGVNEGFRGVAVGMGQFTAAVEAARKAHPERGEKP